MTAINIVVTQDDIDNGKPGDAWSCPITRAAKRVLRPEGLRTGTTAISGPGLHVTLPQRASAFVTDFDRPFGPNPGPFEFTVEVPDEFVREFVPVRTFIAHTSVSQYGIEQDANGDERVTWRKPTSYDYSGSGIDYSYSGPVTNGPVKVGDSIRIQGGAFGIRSTAYITRLVETTVVPDPLVGKTVIAQRTWVQGDALPAGWSLVGTV